MVKLNSECLFEPLPAQMIKIVEFVRVKMTIGTISVRTSNRVNDVSGGFRTVRDCTKLLVGDDVQKAARAISGRLKCCTSLHQTWLRVAVRRLSAEADGNRRSPQ
jgi:hypothetical protein